MENAYKTLQLLDLLLNFKKPNSTCNNKPIKPPVNYLLFILIQSKIYQYIKFFNQFYYHKDKDIENKIKNISLKILNILSSKLSLLEIYHNYQGQLLMVLKKKINIYYIN